MFLVNKKHSRAGKSEEICFTRIICLSALSWSLGTFLCYVRSYLPLITCLYTWHYFMPYLTVRERVQVSKLFPIFALLFRKFDEKYSFVSTRLIEGWLHLFRSLGQTQIRTYSWIDHEWAVSSHKGLPRTKLILPTRLFSHACKIVSQLRWGHSFVPCSEIRAMAFEF